MQKNSLFLDFQHRSHTKFKKKSHEGLFFKSDSTPLALVLHPPFMDQIKGVQTLFCRK